MATSEKKLWTLLLVHQGPKSAGRPPKRHVLSQIDPESTTVEELSKSAAEAFAIKDETAIELQKPAMRGPSFTLLNRTSQDTLATAGLQSQDRIMVVEKDTGKNGKKSSKAKAKTAKKKKARQGSDSEEDIPVQASSSPKGQPNRPRRQAAALATASFAETIRQQDELMAKANSPTKRKRISATTTTSSTKSPSRKNHKAFSSTAGRRLHDGAELQPRRRRRNNEKEDTNPAEALVDATSAQTRQGRLMRAGWKQAVQSAVEQNKAVARLAAVTSGKYRIAVTNHKCNVSFSKGVQGRGEYQDENIDALPVEVLKSVIQSIHPQNAETLRPENLALLSPRVFWSIVHHSTQERSGVVNVVQALQSLLPDLDWSFMRHRKQQLSAKARENLRQQQEELQDWEAAAEAIESVERAMEDSLDFQTDDSPDQSGLLQIEAFVIETPTELDFDELLECISAGSSSVCSDRADEHKGVAQSLVSTCNVHNWRELANRQALDLSNKLQTNHLWVDESIVQEWIDQAQLNTMDELMMEICDGDADAVEMLRENANSGTPKDLANWRGIVGALRECLMEKEGEQVIPAVSQLSSWCDRSYQVLSQFDWLDFYATPVEGECL